MKFKDIGVKHAESSVQSTRSVWGLGPAAVGIPSLSDHTKKHDCFLLAALILRGYIFLHSYTAEIDIYQNRTAHMQTRYGLWS